MHKKNINTLLARFFGNRYSKDVNKRFGLWLIHPRQAEEKEAALNEIWDSLPEMTDLTSLAELKKVNRRIHSGLGRLYRRLAAVAAIIILPLLGVVTTAWYYKQADVSQSVKMLESFALNGERKKLLLSDGSIVWLNAGSVLIYPETFGKTRTLYLSGEGYFSVAKNKEKPFIVKTNYIDVEALGTDFNVQAYPDEHETTTILKSGKVKVEEKTGTAGAIIMSPDEQLVYNHINASFKKSNVDANRLNSWTEGYLIFQRESLGNIFRALERCYNVKLNYNDSQLASMTYTVRFHREETLEEALSVLQQIGVGFKFKIKNKDVYIQFQK